MKITLTINTNNSVQFRELNQGEFVTLGRSSQSNCKLEDGKVSSIHCKFTLKENKLELEDLGSKNGTYLNGIRIEHADLFLGDEIRIGNTIINIEESKTDEEALKVLSFAGNSEDRVGQALKADFTGVRIQNQQLQKIEINTPAVNASRIREVDLRKKVKGKIRLTKEELKRRNKGVSVMATILDVIAIIVVFFIPIFAVIYTPSITKAERLPVLLGMEILCMTSYLFVNFKVAKFTLGEKLAGLHEMYYKQ